MATVPRKQVTPSDKQHEMSIISTRARAIAKTRAIGARARARTRARVGDRNRAIAKTGLDGWLREGGKSK